MLTVGILGCGWLGFPLAKAWAAQGARVHGSTTQMAKLETLAQVGIIPFHIQLNPLPEGDDLQTFLDVAVLVINIPPTPPPHYTPQAGSLSWHAQQIQHLVPKIKQSGVQSVVYISSTSVYPNTNTWVDEQTSVAENGSDLDKGLVDAENLIQTLHPTQNWAILRCGGLLGYNRVPGKYFAGRKNLPNGDTPVNFIFRDDAVQIIQQVVARQAWQEIFNVVAPEHPTRKLIYAHNAQQLGFEAPTFANPSTESYKIVSCQKVIQQLDYQFAYPNPLDFRYE